MSMWKKRWVKLGLLVLPFLTYYAWAPFRSGVNQAVAILSRVDVGAAKAYILSFGVWAPIASFLLMVFQSVAAPLPAFVITFANAALFGWWQGAILSWSSAMAGAALCFVLARLYGRGVVERFTTKAALKQVDVFFARYGKWAVLIARLLPFVSFDVVSYAAGLTGMGFWEFFWATGLGQLPATIVYSYVGGMLAGGVRAFVLGLSLLFALSAAIVAGRQIWQERQVRRASDPAR